jgi:hypothetical protein
LQRILDLVATQDGHEAAVGNKRVLRLEPENLTAQGLIN